MDKARTGRFIAQMRMDRGLTSGELADLIGISAELLEAYESGAAFPRSDVIYLGGSLAAGPFRS